MKPQPRFRVLVAALMIFSATFVYAQEQPQQPPTDARESAVSDVIRRVVFDPTTYAPAAISYAAMRLDWNSSQPFFQNGYNEHNPRYTISGLPNSAPLGYAAGNHQILMDTLTNLQISLVNNFTDQIVERALVGKYPEHRKLIRTLGWVERVGFAVFATWSMSSSHFQQWQQNQRLMPTVR